MLNKITIQGRFSRDPELRATNSGKQVTSFSLACERDYSPDGKDRETDFFDVVVWGNSAQFVSRNFIKGQMAIVSGRLQTRKWTDKNGQNRVATEIVADNVYFCGKKESGAEGNQTANSASFAPPYVAADALDELPLLEDDGPMPF